jgi:hypothetical protein
MKQSMYFRNVTYINGVDVLCVCVTYPLAVCRNLYNSILFYEMHTYAESFFISSPTLTWQYVATIALR